MPIIKRGFEAGFRARKTAASFDRRAHYLGSEHDREKAILLTRSDEEPVTPQRAIDEMGGKDVEYHEVIIAPSALECQAIREASRNPDTAAEETAHRLSQAYAGDRPYVVAVHWSDDGRFHYHLTTTGDYPKNLEGERGLMQKVWDENWIIKERESIQNWKAWGEYKGVNGDLDHAIKEMKAINSERRREMKEATPEQRSEIVARSQAKELSLAERKYGLEIRAIETRYKAYGRPGSTMEKVEKEGADHRHTKTINQIQARGIRAQMDQEMVSRQKDSISLQRDAIQRLKAEPDNREGILGSHRQAQTELFTRQRVFEEDLEKRRWATEGKTDERDLEKALLEVQSRFHGRVSLSEMGLRLEEVKDRLQEIRETRGTLFKEASKDDRAAALPVLLAEEKELLMERRDLRVKILETDMEVRGRLWSPEHERHLHKIVETEGRRIQTFEDRAEINEKLTGIRKQIYEGRRERAEGGGADGSADLGKLRALQQEEMNLARQAMVLELARLEQRRSDVLDRGGIELEKVRILEQRKQLEEVHRLQEEAATARTELDKVRAEIRDAEVRAQEAEQEEDRQAAQREAASKRDEEGRLMRLAIALEIEAAILSQAGPIAKELPAPSREDMEAAALHALNRREGGPTRETLRQMGEELERLDRSADLTRQRFEAVGYGQVVDEETSKVYDQLHALREARGEALAQPHADREAVAQDFASQMAPLQAQLRELERERLEARFAGKEAGPGSDAHHEAVQALEARQSLRDEREGLHLEREILGIERWEAAKAAPTPTLREEAHAAHDALELDLARRTLDLERREISLAHPDPEAPVHRLEVQNAEARFQAVEIRQGLDRDIRLVRDQLREIREERHEALAPAGTDRQAVAQEFGGQMAPHQAQLRELERERLDTYFMGREEGLGSEKHQEAIVGLKASHEVRVEREGLYLEREILGMDRWEQTGQAASIEQREALHQGFDAKELRISKRLQEMDEAGIAMKFKDAETPAEKAQEEQALADVKARYEAIEKRQALDQESRQVQDQLQGLREARQEAFWEEGADRQAVAGEYAAQMTPLQAQLASLDRERLDTRFMGREEGLGSEKHQAAITDLQERQVYQAAKEGLGTERAILQADRWEQTAQAPAVDQREALHEGFDTRERDLSDRLLALEERELRRQYAPELAEAAPGLPKGFQEELAQAQQRHDAVELRQGIDRDSRQVRDQIQGLKEERSEALERPGEDRQAVARDYAARMEPLQAQLASLERERLDTQYMGRREGLGSLPHQEAHAGLLERQAFHSQKEGIHLEREILHLDRQTALVGHETAPQREQVHTQFDARELALARRLHELETKEIHRTHPDPASGTRADELFRVDERFRAVEMRQGIDRELRGLQEQFRASGQARFEALRAPDADLRSIQASYHAKEAPILDRIAVLERERLDTRYMGKDASRGIGSPSHQEARIRLAEDQGLRGKIRELRGEIEGYRHSYQNVLRDPYMGSKGQLEGLKRLETGALGSIRDLEKARIDLRHGALGTLNSSAHIREIKDLDIRHTARVARVQERATQLGPPAAMKVMKAVRTAHALHGRDPHQLSKSVAKKVVGKLFREALKSVPAVRIVVDAIRTITR